MKFSLFFALYIIAWLTSTVVFAADSKTAIYMSVFKAGEDSVWAKDTCKKIYQALRDSDSVGTEIHCDWNQDEKFLSSKNTLVRKTNYFRSMLELKESENEYHLRWINWSAEDDLDFTQVGWTLKKDRTTPTALRKLLNNILEQQNYRWALRRHFVTQAIQFSQNISLDHPLTEGEILAWLTKDPKNKSYLKNILDLQLRLGLGVSDEIKNKEAAKSLWDADSMHTMLGEASKLKQPIDWKTLNSRIDLPLMCQSDSLKSLDLLTCSNAASMLWEMILDYHESLSLRQELLPLETGFFINETALELKNIFLTGTESLAQKNLRQIFKSEKEIENLVPLLNVRPAPSFQIISSTIDKKTRADTTYLQTAAGPKKLITTIDFRSRFNNAKLFEPYKDFRSSAEIALSAYYEKGKFLEIETPVPGYNIFIGARKAVDNRTLFNSSGNPKISDFISSVHVFGSTLRLTTYSHGWRIRAILDIYADFASVRSYAIDRQEFEGDVLEVSALKKHDSYAAVGSTNLAQLVFERGNFSFDISSQHQRLSNLNGIDPQPYLPQGVTVTGRADQFVGIEFGAQYRLNKNTSVRFAINETQRSGHIQDVDSKSSVNETVGLQLIYRF